MTTIDRPLGCSCVEKGYEHGHVLGCPFYRPYDLPSGACQGSTPEAGSPGAGVRSAEDGPRPPAGGLPASDSDSSETVCAAHGSLVCEPCAYDRGRLDGSHAAAQVLDEERTRYVAAQKRNAEELAATTADARALRKLLEEVRQAYCASTCPTTYRTGPVPPHTDLCQMAAEATIWGPMP